MRFEISWPNGRAGSNPVGDVFFAPDGSSFYFFALLPTYCISCNLPVVLIQLQWRSGKRMEEDWG